MKNLYNIENFFWFGIFKKLDKKKRLTFLICTYSIFIIIVFAQGGYFIQNNSSVYGYRTALIQQRINNIEDMNKFMETEAIILAEKINQLSQTNEKTELKKLSRLTGIQPFTRGGIELILKDSKAPLENDEEYMESVVHNNDLLKMTNSLWSLGAEAISINGNRILFNTEIVCSGPAIIINDNIINSPFYIKAGGDFKELIKIKDDDYINFLKSRNIEFSVKKMDNVNIPSSDTYISKGG